MKYTTKISAAGKSLGRNVKRPAALSKPTTVSSTRSLPKFNFTSPLGNIKLPSFSSKNSGNSKKKNFFSNISASNKKKIRNVLIFLGSSTLILLVIAGVWAFSYVQKLSEELPPLSDPFRDQEIASTVTDRKGVELTKFIGDYKRDPVNINDIPENIKWTFLAAEDIDFYNHQGFDPAAILRCGLISASGAGLCGGSTITQQAAKITVFGGEQRIERKIKELLMALKIEQAYSKDEILQLYLTVAPFGGQIYGITAAADFYFNKRVQDLTLAEGAILASIVQNPSRLSPTLGYPTPDEAKVAVKARQENVVLNQMERYINKINEQTRINKANPELEDVVTLEMIEEAKTAELKYEPPILTSKKAGHFVDYVTLKLTTENYKFGTEPFTQTELFNGGYQITTTLDYELQQVAEQQVAGAINSYGANYDVSNAALMTVKPDTGQVLTMVGSKSYYGVDEGCDANGQNCRYNPQVNVLNTRQSPGSSTKPFGTYEAYKEGKLFTGSFLPDVPIDLPDGYSLKNWNGSYFGATDKTFASQMLSDSRNLPAVVVVEAIGIPRFVQTMQEFGYSTFQDVNQYGPSVILGGSDVLPLEHAQAHSAFANQGNLVRNEIILKITDRNGNVVWEYKQPNATKVADERAAYMLNQSVFNNGGMSWDGRDVSMKTGTSENSTDVWVVAWSPDFVTVAWMGNNNNQNMNFNAFGETIAKPWVKEYMRLVGDTPYFSNKTPFNRPAGVITGGGCGNEDRSQCIGDFVGLSGGYMLEGVQYPVDNRRSKVKVCKDQKDRLARPIDEALDLTEEIVVNSYILTAVPYWQGFVDKYMAQQYEIGAGLPNGGPTKSCDIDRTGGVTGVSFTSLNITSPAAGKVRYQGKAVSTNGAISKIRFMFGSAQIGEVATGTFDQTFDIPAGVENGVYPALVIATDPVSSTPSAATSITVGGINTGLGTTLQIGGAAPAVINYASFITDTVRVNYTGTSIVNSATLIITKDGVDLAPVSMTCVSNNCTFGLNATIAPDDNIDSVYRFRVTANITSATTPIGVITGTANGPQTVVAGYTANE